MVNGGEVNNLKSFSQFYLGIISNCVVILD